MGCMFKGNADSPNICVYCGDSGATFNYISRQGKVVSCHKQCLWGAHMLVTKVEDVTDVATDGIGEEIE